jgi:hypothetical protein
VATESGTNVNTTINYYVCFNGTNYVQITNNEVTWKDCDPYTGNSVKYKIELIRTDGVSNPKVTNLKLYYID